MDPSFSGKLSDLNFATEEANSSPAYTAMLTLIHQNEDLSARVRALVQRLFEIEERVVQKDQQLQEEQERSRFLKDEQLVWKEKQKTWTEQREKLLLELHQTTALRKRLQTATQRVVRFEKYQEKIKTQVKPYIRTLRSLAEELAQQKSKLTLELEKSQAAFENLQKKYSSDRNTLEIQNDQLRNQYDELVTQFEQTRSELQNKINDLQDQVFQWESRNLKIEDYVHRNHDLENLVISMKHEFQEQKQGLFQDLRSKAAEVARAEDTAVQTQIKFEALTVSHSRLESEVTALKQNLETTRQLWAEKSRESEELRLRLESFERLNKELMQKLREARTS